MTETYGNHPNETNGEHSSQEAQATENGLNRSDSLITAIGTTNASVNEDKTEHNDPSSPNSFDNWIDEFKKTVLPTAATGMSIADALYKLEASKDIPTIVHKAGQV